MPEQPDEYHSTCPSCGQDNVLITADMPGGLEIACSHCGFPIGFSIQSTSRRETDKAQVRR